MYVNAGLSLHKCRELCSGNTNCTGRAGLVQAVKSFFFPLGVVHCQAK